VGTAAESVAYHLSGWYQRLRGSRLTDLVTDPVCPMRVDPARAAATRRHNGAEFAFCSARCARRFESDPGRYLTAASRPAGER
jgi:YHS domain-containing protein